LLGYALLCISALGFWALAISVYSQPVVTPFFEQIYWHTLKIVFPFIGGAGIYGINAIFYFFEMLFATMILKRGSGDRKAMSFAVKFGLASIFVFEAGLGVFQPRFENWSVITAQQGTALAWFTNFDLLIVSGVALALLVSSRAIGVIRHVA
jgi:hypothetical protein